VINRETILAVLEGAAAERAPVILMVYPSLTPVEHWPGLIALMRTEVERLDVRACLHLDHARELGLVRAALDLGFTSVMVDGSTLSMAENVALTRQAVAQAQPRGISVEAELGYVGRGDEVLTVEEAARRLTQPEEAEQFLRETGVDALAVAIGTAHGLYRAQPKLDLERLRQLRSALPAPLVLHGGSGTPDGEIRQAIAGGICKVNFWTEVALAMVAMLKEQLSAPLEQCHLPLALAAAQEGARQVVQQKIRLLGATGRAD